MPLLPDAAMFREKLAGFPVVKYKGGALVLAAGHATGKLLILRKGAVEVLKDGERVAKVDRPGAVFGELAALLDQPHTADVRAIEDSEFHVAEAATVLTTDPTLTLYIAAILAQRLASANQALIEIKHQIHAGDSNTKIGKMLKKAQLLLRPGGDAGFIYSHYPSDSFGGNY